MKLGLYLRNMGSQSTRGLIADAARAAEEAGIDDLWVADHLALAPEESQGSDGRYLEPLATLRPDQPVHAVAAASGAASGAWLLTRWPAAPERPLDAVPARPSPAARAEALRSTRSAWRAMLEAAAASGERG